MTPRQIFAASIIVALAYVVFVTARIGWSARTSKVLVAEARAFQSDHANLPRNLLVIGDSTAVGVGSPSALSVPGRLGEYLNASVENIANSGATTVDLAAQIALSRRARYDLVLVQIGANDVIRLRSLTRAADALDSALASARKKSDRVMVLTAGDIGHAPIFPWPANWLMSARTRDLRTRFMEVIQHRKSVYVDIYSRPDPFDANPAQYYAADGLHLTGDGYGFWFTIVKEQLNTSWPDLR